MHLKKEVDVVMSKKIFLIAVLTILLVGLFGCVAGVGKQTRPIYDVPPLQGLVIKDINLNGRYPIDTFSMKDALKQELTMAGAQVGSDGVVLDGDARIFVGRRQYICRAIMVVHIESSAKLHSTVYVNVTCMGRGTVFISPEDYKRAAQLVVQDFIRQTNR